MGVKTITPATSVPNAIPTTAEIVRLLTHLTAAKNIMMIVQANARSLVPHPVPLHIRLRSKAVNMVLCKRFLTDVTELVISVPPKS